MKFKKAKFEKLAIVILGIVSLALVLVIISFIYDKPQQESIQVTLDVVPTETVTPHSSPFTMPQQSINKKENEPPVVKYLFDLFPDYLEVTRYVTGRLSDDYIPINAEDIYLGIDDQPLSFQIGSPVSKPFELGTFSLFVEDFRQADFTYSLPEKDFNALYLKYKLRINQQSVSSNRKNCMEYTCMISLPIMVKPDANYFISVTGHNINLIYDVNRQLQKDETEVILAASIDPILKKCRFVFSTDDLFLFSKNFPNIDQMCVTLNKIEDITGIPFDENYSFFVAPQYLQDYGYLGKYLFFSNAIIISENAYVDAFQRYPDGLSHIVLHEMVHANMGLANTRMSDENNGVWLGEGIAEYVSQTATSDGKPLQFVNLKESEDIQSWAYEDLTEKQIEDHYTYSKFIVASFVSKYGKAKFKKLLKIFKEEPNISVYAAFQKATDDNSLNMEKILFPLRKKI